MKIFPKYVLALAVMFHGIQVYSASDSAEAADASEVAIPRAPFHITNVLRECPDLAKWWLEGHNFFTQPESRKFGIGDHQYVLEYAMFQGASGSETFRGFAEGKGLLEDLPTLYEGGALPRYTWNNQKNPHGPWYNISVSALDCEPSDAVAALTLQQVFDAVPSLADFKSSTQVWLAPGETPTVFVTEGASYTLRMAAGYMNSWQTFEDYVNGLHKVPGFKEVTMPFGTIQTWVVREDPADATSKMLAVLSFQKDGEA